MTPKEKAKEIYQKMLGDDGSTHPKVFGGVKRCALIAVDEILSLAVDWCEPHEIHDGTQIYWQEVKQEIEKL
jgi:hypothetical protein